MTENDQQSPAQAISQRLAAVAVLTDWGRPNLNNIVDILDKNVKGERVQFNGSLPKELDQDGFLTIPNIPRWAISALYTQKMLDRAPYFSVMVQKLAGQTFTLVPYVGSQELFDSLSHCKERLVRPQLSPKKEDVLSPEEIATGYNPESIHTPRSWNKEARREIHIWDAVMADMSIHFNLERFLAERYGVVI